MSRLSGRTAVVTGGAKGIGRHYSLALAAEGARVMIADIADGTAVAQEIAGKHGANSVESAIADVSDETSVKALVAAAIERFGKIDVLVNNAALFAPLQETKCTEIDGELWDKVMAVNLRGPFLMVKHVAPHMIAQGYGKIINIGSAPPFAASRGCCTTSPARAASWRSRARSRASSASTASASTRWRRALP